jgi:hypothetical protein
MIVDYVTALEALALSFSDMGCLYMYVRLGWMRFANSVGVLRVQGEKRSVHQAKIRQGKAKGFTLSLSSDCYTG